LPIPETWGDLSVAAQADHDTSTLGLYRSALASRRESEALRAGSFAWQDAPPGAVVFGRGSADEEVVVAVNVAAESLGLPRGDLLLASRPDVPDRLPPGTAAWVRLR